MPARKRKSIIQNDEPKTKRASLGGGSLRARSPIFRLGPIWKSLEERDVGIVLAMGQNDVGQLGLGEDVESRKRPARIEELDDVVSVVCGGMHTIVLHKNGDVSTFGCNDANALGRDGNEFDAIKVKLPARAVQISAGDSHSAALLEDGRVFVWGSFRDNSGDIGLTAESKDGRTEKTPVQFLPDKEIVKVCSGDDHLVFLTAEGYVYTCGNPDSGQLGRLSKRYATRETRQGLQALLSPGLVDIHKPKRSSSKVRCCDIWTGSYCTFAKDASSDDIYVFGLSNYKQLGLDIEEPQFHPVASKVFQNKSWKQIACGMHHTLGLDEHGKVYSLGRADSGQLGLGTTNEAVGEPTIIPALQDKTCVNIACGTFVSYAITDDGTLYAWGFGENNQLGGGNDQDILTPQKVTGPMLENHLVMDVDAGGQHTVLIAKKIE